ncbi:alpha-galactosidase [Sanguibacter sp. A247]|uniref:alpha-galactosidase n=1 Tax=unclassified Sanguibacter TaxID=2645534 RepID=UPI003FD886FB
MSPTPAVPIHLRAAGTSVLVAADQWGQPAVMHWGRALEDRDVSALVATSAPAIMPSSFEVPRTFALTATRHHGWSGTPALDVVDAQGATFGPLVWEGVTVRDGGVAPARTTTSDSPLAADPVVRAGASAVLALRDAHGRGAVELTLTIDAAGVLSVAATITATGTTLDVRALTALLPLPGRAAEILDLTGRWGGERHPQRRPVADGTWLRAVRRGRPGHDDPGATVVGTSGFTSRRGEVWGAHIAWSGDRTQIVERLPEGAGVLRSVVGGGELLEPREVVLSPGESYRAPHAVFAWSDAGLDGLSERFHAHVRAFPSAPATPRPLVLNTWEAVYFDHDLARLTTLADRAAEVGVERFVLDDGWFRGRRDDTAGLGDWYVDATVWPRGLEPLAEYVHSLGMEFGLWFEPEMVNPDSDLARTHPDWVLGEVEGLTWRNQLALDLTNPDVVDYILERISATVAALGVDFIKWDHNRELHASLTAARGARRIHQQTRALYRMLDELRARHPGLEIESCASGGARVDLGVLSHTQRVWASDTNDPVERQRIQRWTSLVLPPEVVGSHVGPPTAHTTHRATSLSFRLITALFGHAGIEWDLTACPPDELDMLTRWARLYRELRPLLHSGRVVHADDVDAGAFLDGVVSRDRRDGVFAWGRTVTSATGVTERVTFPGLDPALDYVVRVRPETGPAARAVVTDPAWFAGTTAGVVVPGSMLTHVGVPLPTLAPAQALLLDLRAVEQ